MKKNFKNEILRRAMFAFKCKKVNELAHLIDITPQNLNGYLDRGTFIKLIENLAFDRKININWILTGQGSITAGHGTGIRINENDAPYSGAPDIEPPIQTTPPHRISRTQDLLSKTAAIIESQTIFSDALKSNIEAFSVGMNLQQDLSATRALLHQHSMMLQKQDETIHQQQDRMNTVEEQLRSIEKKKAG